MGRSREGRDRASQLHQRFRHGHETGRQIETKAHIGRGRERQLQKKAEAEGQREEQRGRGRSRQGGRHRHRNREREAQQTEEGTERGGWRRNGKNRRARTRTTCSWRATVEEAVGAPATVQLKWPRPRPAGGTWKASRSQPAAPHSHKASPPPLQPLGTPCLGKSHETNHASMILSPAST